MVLKLRMLYQLAATRLNLLQPALLLVLRAYWGYQFFIAGRGKLMNIDRTAEFFATLNIPLPMVNAYMAGATECLGGLLLLVGLAARAISIPLIFTMLVAYGTAHTAELRSIFSNPDAFTSAPPFLFLLTATIVLVFGPGCLSVDELLKRFVWNRESSSMVAAAATIVPMAPLGMSGQHAKK